MVNESPGSPPSLFASQVDGAQRAPSLLFLPGMAPPLPGICLAGSGMSFISFYRAISCSKVRETLPRGNCGHGSDSVPVWMGDPRSQNQHGAGWEGAPPLLTQLVLGGRRCLMVAKDKEKAATHLPVPSNATKPCWSPLPVLKKQNQSFVSRASGTSSTQRCGRGWKPLG